MKCNQFLYRIEKTHTQTSDSVQTKFEVFMCLCASIQNHMISGTTTEQKRRIGIRRQKAMCRVVKLAEQTQKLEEIQFYVSFPHNLRHHFVRKL